MSRATKNNPKTTNKKHQKTNPLLPPQTKERGKKPCLAASFLQGLFYTPAEQ